jgi:hypothetical protein
MKDRSVLSKYSYVWITLILFLISLIGHWIFSWHAYKQEQEEHNQPAEVGSYIVETSRDTLENWQSEFLQLIWQVAGLSFLFYVGSPQSKEGDDRKEKKLDEILMALDPEKAKKVIKNLDKKYPKK